MTINAAKKTSDRNADSWKVRVREEKRERECL